jgi:hypothetical protein
VCHWRRPVTGTRPGPPRTVSGRVRVLGPVRGGDL